MSHLKNKNKDNDEASVILHICFITAPVRNYVKRHCGLASLLLCNCPGCGAQGAGPRGVLAFLVQNFRATSGF